MSTERSRLAAKRFNKFIERASQALLTVGLAVTTGALLALDTHSASFAMAGWAALAGMAQMALSLVLPIWMVSEE